jgi:hypothetical protein
VSTFFFDDVALRRFARFPRIEQAGTNFGKWLISTLICVAIALPTSGKAGWNMSASDDQPGGTARSDGKGSDDSQAARCATQLKAFISELDELLPVAKSSDVLQALIARHFPLYGCNVDEAMSISRQSRYFDHINTTYPKDVLIVFRYGIPNGWGFRVSFGLTRPNGNSRLPNAGVDKTQ